ncbi:hypothetical protein [Desulfomonile tiedjei]|uniref:Uncharacterized protein n=1 Tax=Desulfomonile tiedjei (strain ATCC 49306 / DSM 6799 / DCB-1) TaxID=706587 RepID=I4C6Z3_DESTA|nr:hypothetical protein [Desulfomonile tiedjei]AFM25334.1 hypothetical protein Desti_2655 [Desulfomonile tiedjei DSM 6799]
MNKVKLIALAAVIVIFTGATVMAQYRGPSSQAPASGRIYYYYGPYDQPYSDWGLPSGSGADTSLWGQGSPSGQSGGSPSAQYQTSGRGIGAADGSVSGAASPSGQSGGSPSAQYRTSW